MSSTPKSIFEGLAVCPCFDTSPMVFFIKSSMLTEGALGVAAGASTNENSGSAGAEGARPGNCEAGARAAEEDAAGLAGVEEVLEGSTPKSPTRLLIEDEVVGALEFFEEGPEKSPKRSSFFEADPWPVESPPSRFPSKLSRGFAFGAKFALESC